MLAVRQAIRGKLENKTQRRKKRTKNTKILQQRMPQQALENDEKTKKEGEKE